MDYMVALPVGKCTCARLDILQAKCVEQKVWFLISNVMFSGVMIACRMKCVLVFFFRFFGQKGKSRLVAAVAATNL